MTGGRSNSFFGKKKDMLGLDEQKAPPPMPPKRKDARTYPAHSRGSDPTYKAKTYCRPEKKSRLKSQ